MAEAKRVPGATERAARRMIREMGVLPARQALTAKELLKLARMLDEEIDGSKAASLSRELRQVMNTLRAGAPALERPAGPTGDVVVDLQAKREKRRTGNGTD